MSSFASTGRTLNEHLGQYQASASEPRPSTPSRPALNFLHLTDIRWKIVLILVELGRGQLSKELF